MLLSGGERRRAEITRALVISPKFILLDEPFAGIDPIAVSDIQKIIFHLRDRGIGVLITDHNVRETLAITDRAYILYDGKILVSGSASEIASSPIATVVPLKTTARPAVSIARTTASSPVRPCARSSRQRTTTSSE